MIIESHKQILFSTVKKIQISIFSRNKKFIKKMFTFLPSRNLTGPSIIGIKSPMISKFWLHVWKVKNTFVNNGNMGWLSSTPQHIAGRAPPKESADAGAFQQQGWKPIHIPPAGRAAVWGLLGEEGEMLIWASARTGSFFHIDRGGWSRPIFCKALCPICTGPRAYKGGASFIYFFISKISPCNTFRRIF